MIIGLTGGIGSGKSEAARIFTALGVPVVDSDAIAHELTAAGQPALTRLAAAFGAEVIAADGSLNRVWLRKKVFSDRAAKQTLEGILHPLIRAEIVARLGADADAPYRIIMVPLLFETGAYADLITRSLVIDCDESLQISRAMARSRLTEPEVRAIMDTQCFREQRLALADDVIVNDDSLENLETQVRAQHKKYSGLHS
ncbi:MAG: dephospho-CoA kinase [Methylobacillus sp.]|jgi:dephospho-CoA kinase|nr:dephospho-CoA kinase [Methylobacillus sp.]